MRGNAPGVLAGVDSRGMAPLLGASSPRPCPGLAARAPALPDDPLRPHVHDGRRARPRRDDQLVADPALRPPGPTRVGCSGRCRRGWSWPAPASRSPRSRRLRARPARRARLRPGSPPTTREGSKFASFASGKPARERHVALLGRCAIGFALGPLLASFFVITLGLGVDGGVLIVAGLIRRGGAAFVPPHLARFAPDEVGQAQRSAAGNDWRGTLMLLATVGLRSLAHKGLFTFIPLYEPPRGNRAAYGTQMLAVFLFAGAWTLIGGPLADWPGAAGCCSGVSSCRHRSSSSTCSWAAGRRRRALLRGHGCDRDVRRHPRREPGVHARPRRGGLRFPIGLAIGLGGVAAVALGAVATRSTSRLPCWRQRSGRRSASS